MMATALATRRPTTADRLTNGEIDLDWLVNALMVAQGCHRTALAALDDFCSLFFRCDYRSLIAAYRLYRPYVDRQAEAGLAAMRQQIWCTTMPKALLTSLLGELSVSQGYRGAVVLARKGLRVVWP